MHNKNIFLDITSPYSPLEDRLFNIEKEKRNEL